MSLVHCRAYPIIPRHKPCLPVIYPPLGTNLTTSGGRSEPPNDRGSRTHFSVHHRQTAGFWLEAGRDRGPGFVGTPVAGIPVPRRRENAERYTGPYANGDVAFSYTL
jgi:hypothetical protein